MDSIMTFQGDFISWESMQKQLDEYTLNNGRLPEAIEMTRQQMNGFRNAFWPQSSHLLQVNYLNGIPVKEIAEKELIKQ